MALKNFDLANSAAIDQAMKEISKKELMKLLKMAGLRIIQQHKVFERHWKEGQSSWSAPTDAYAKFVKKRYGGSGRFDATGAARKALGKKPTKTGPLGLTVSKKFNSLTIHLRKMVNGKNVYGIAQLGKFRGLTTKDGKQVSAKKAIEINREASSKYKKNQMSGGNAKWGDVMSATAKKHGTDGAKRNSESPRHITEVQSSDHAAVEESIMAEIEATLKHRGIKI